MRKIPKYVLQYFSETWSKENRKIILKSFKISIDKKCVRYKNNFIEEKKFEKKIKVYDRNNPLFNEFNQIKVGTLNWYENLSLIAKLYIKEFSKRKRKEENARLPSSYSAKQYSVIEKQLDRLTEYFISNENYYCFLRNDLELRDSAINRFVFNREPLYSPSLLIDKIKLYAIKNKMPYFNLKGNLLSGVIKDYINGKKKLPMSEYEKIKNSVKRTEKEFWGLAFANLEEFKYFVTLTFADKEKKNEYEENNKRSVSFGEYDLKFLYIENSADYDLCINQMNTFFSNFRREMKRKNLELKYLGVPEYQKNGNIHYHFLMNDIPDEFLYEIPSWLDFDYKIKSRRFDKGIKKWVYGKSTVEPINNPVRIVKYITKYLMKSLEEIKETGYLEHLNKRRYYYSRKLNKPLNEYYLNVEEIMEEFGCNKENSLILFEKTNLNFYNQNQSILYALKDFEKEEC